MNKKARIAVFVSGGGTNLQALIDAAASGVIKHGEIVLVVSSKPGVRALERAANAGINSVVVSRAGSLNRDEFENDMLAAIRAANTELIVLAGFLSVLSARFIRECGCLNTLSQTAQDGLANLITLLLGITISFSMRAEQFVQPTTILIMALGLFAFVFDTIGGCLLAKLINIFSKKRVLLQ